MGAVFRWWQSSEFFMKGKIMAQMMNQGEVIRWMDDLLGHNPEIRANADRVIAGMWSFAERMQARTPASKPTATPMTEQR